MTLAVFDPRNITQYNEPRFSGPSGSLFPKN